MKSTTIRRSNLSKEKMAVLEALRKYKGDDSDFGPNVYIRPAEVEHDKKEELDVLWRNFKLHDIQSSEAPRVYIATGLVAGAVLLGAVSMTLFFANKINSANNVAEESGAFGIAPVSAQAAQTPSKSETYVVQNGDTIEKILIRFHGSYSKNTESALLKANNLSNPNKLSIGQELIIPMN